MNRILLDVWSNMTKNFPKYATDAYSAIDPWFYPILFLGIIGYIYAYMRSTTVAVVAILITFGVFAATTTVFNQADTLVTFMYIVVIIGIVSLIVTFVMHNKRY